jgi:NADH-quinone oxidoreductase subunit D
MDRLDYVSMMSNEHAYCLAIEKLMGLEVPVRAQYIRVMFSEITRLLNHLLWLGAHGLDCGAMNMPDLLLPRTRRPVRHVRGRIGRAHARCLLPSGRRRTATCRTACRSTRSARSRTSGPIKTLNENRQGSLLDFIDDFARRFPHYVDDYETLLTDNRIWKQRTVGVGVVSPERALNLGFHRPDAAWLRLRLGPAQEAALRGL